MDPNDPSALGLDTNALSLASERLDSAPMIPTTSPPDRVRGALLLAARLGRYIDHLHREHAPTRDRLGGEAPQLSEPARCSGVGLEAGTVHRHDRSWHRFARRARSRIRMDGPMRVSACRRLGKIGLGLARYKEQKRDKVDK